jgi:hypothetical protein
MRPLAVGLLLAFSVALAFAPGAHARPRALVAFVPAGDGPGLMLELAERGLAYGMTSPTLGRYSDRQMLLDVTQGARLSSSAYDSKFPGSLDFVPGTSGRGRIAGWPGAVERAEDAPGDIVPGLLAQRLEEAGRGIAYAGGRGGEELEAVVAAGRSGVVERASLGPEAGAAVRALALWREHYVVVARLPAGSAGLVALDRILASRRPEDLVYVLRAPPSGDERRLLPTGVAGPGFEGALRSDTTRQDGLVAATDLPVTLLEHVGVDVPGEMDGQAAEGGGEASPEDVRERSERLGLVLERRASVLLWFLLSCLALVAGAALAQRRALLAGALRTAFLAALWLPGVALLAAALSPASLAEVAGSALAALLAGALTDRFVPWPVAPALPAAVVLGAHLVDLAFGSPLIGGSILGPNPEGGARFFGIGNELETVLGAEILLGTGAALSGLRARRPALAFGLVCLAAALAIGAGRLGADVGAVITLGAGAAGAILALQPGGPSRRAIALALSLPPAGLVALVALDLVLGGGAHLTRTVLEADSGEDVAQVLARRVGLSFGGLADPVRLLEVLLALGLVVWGVRNRSRLYAPLQAHPEWTAGLTGALAATVAGALANDSGPVVFITGTVALVLATGYVRGHPEGGAGAAGRWGRDLAQSHGEPPAVRLR